jgi:hypothetical protein
VTAPVIAQPDLEAWVWSSLSDLAGVTSFAFSAAQLDMPGWIWEHSVQVDCRAARKGAARQLAETARQRIAGLSAVPWPEGVICYAQVTEGPFWMPDVDGGPRYCTRWEIRVHPARTSWEPATGTPHMRPATRRGSAQQPRIGASAAPAYQEGSTP